MSDRIFFPDKPLVKIDFVKAVGRNQIFLNWTVDDGNQPIEQYSIQVNTGCNRRNGPDFGRVFLMLNYTENPQNTYIQSSMVTEI